MSGGVPQYCELVWTSGRRARALAGGLIAPREKTLVQPAARWLLSGDHLSLRMSSSFTLSLALREEDDGKRTGSVTETDNSARSRKIKRLSSISPSLTPNEIMSLTVEGRWSCWVKRTGECSLPLRVMARHAGIEPTWARLSLGRSRSLKRKLTASAERQDWNTRSVSIQPCWAQRQRGISPSVTHTQRECHQRAGDSRKSYNNGTAFATTLCGNLLF